MSSTPFEDAMKELMADMEKARENLAKAQQGIQSTSGKARSKSRMLSVTVDGRGEVTELKFHNQTWRSMAPGELSKVIVQTIKDARAAAQKEMLAAVSPYVPDGVDLAAAFSGEQDWSQALPTDMELPSIVKDFLGETLQSADTEQKDREGDQHGKTRAKTS